MHATPIATPSTPRRISILGATGSIGDSTLRVLVEHPDRFTVAALTAHDNAEKLIRLAKQFRPEMVAIGNPARYALVQSELSPLGIRVTTDIDEAASLPCDISVAAIVGAAGLKPTLCAIEHAGQVALANKEALVCAGALMLNACTRHATQLIPIDSEHNAIFQVLHGSVAQVEQITLTASGGPLRTRALDSFASVTPEEAMKHPRWNMGAKISIDSATMANKGLELIEAHYLFGVPEHHIHVLLHPESIIHSLVHYTDGSVLAQLGMPDMRIPIAYALSWPNRLEVNTPRLNLAELGALHFESVEHERYPLLRCARDALRNGPSHCITFNAANEIAVERFMAGKISFTDISAHVAEAVDKTESCTISSIADVLECDQHVRQRV